MKLGLLSYINILPVTLGLESGAIKGPGDLEMVSRHPSQLNQMISAGELTVSPVSSIQWLDSLERYTVVPQLCIASKGPVRSVQLFSRVPIDELKDEEIGVTGASATSCMLLRIVKPNLVQVPIPITDFAPDQSLDAGLCFPERFRAVLLIGDLALRFAQDSNNFVDSLDLGSAWRDLTGLPTVYAIWLGLREAQSQSKVRTITETLRTSRSWGEEHLDRICQAASQRIGLSEQVVEEYYQGLGYRFGEAEAEGLIEFYQRAAKIQGRPGLPKSLEAELRGAAQSDSSQNSVVSGASA